MNKFLTLLFIVVSIPVHCQSLYVDGTNGNNSNNGSSIGSAWKTIQYAMDNAAAGNTVYIRTGTYKEALELNVSGSVGSPITFINYMNETVMIDGNNAAVTLLYIVGKSNIVVQGLVFQNTLGNNSVGVQIEGKSKNIVFKKNKIHNINWTSSKSTIPGAQNNSNPFLVYGNNATTAISNITVDSNEIYDNITGFSESLTLDGNVDNFSITNNVVHDNVNIGILCAGNYKVSSAPSTDHARNGVVQNNLVYNCNSNYATAAGIYIDGGKNILVERNKVYNNGYGIEIGCEELGTTTAITVRDNFVFDNIVSGIAVGGYNYPATGQVLNCIIENNSLYKNDNTTSGNGEIVISKASNCMIRNNILFANSQNIAISSSYGSLQSNVFNYNAYYLPSTLAADVLFVFNNTTYNGLSNFHSSTSQELNGLFTDPLFVNTNLTNQATVDLSLSTGSLYIDAGNPSHSLLSKETDYFHYERIANSTIDIGATEFNSVLAGTINETKNQLFSVYPNPFSEFITIKHDASFIIKGYSILNTFGEEILSGGSAGLSDKINLASLSKGIYIVKLTNGTSFFFYKIIKQ